MARPGQSQQHVRRGAAAHLHVQEAAGDTGRHGKDGYVRALGNRCNLGADEVEGVLHLRAAQQVRLVEADRHPRGRPAHCGQQAGLGLRERRVDGEHQHGDVDTGKNAVVVSVL